MSLKKRQICNAMPNIANQDHKADKPKITVAKSAGFCFGVGRAVDMALKTVRRPCYTVGPLIHNKYVTDMLSGLGIKIAEDIGAIEPGATVIIRSHGISKATMESLMERGFNIVNATCPYVSKIHDIVSRESIAGRLILIFGDLAHPEVTATAGWCGEYIVFDTEKSARSLINRNEKLKNTPVSLVAQTTASRDEWEKCVKFLKKVCTNIKILDTICNATNTRQSDAKALSMETDVMLVIGDRRSANTLSLARACRNPILAESVKDLDMAQLSRFKSIGVTAGASTPAAIIGEVVRKMSEEIKNGDIGESFEELLEQSLKTLNTGDKVTGIITAVTPSEVHVDLGTKHAGYIVLSELTDDPTAKPEDLVKVGDEIETFVVRVNDVEGTAMLSKKRLDTVKSWEDVEAAKDNHSILEGFVVEENKGGVVVSIKGVRVFVPASQTGLPKDTPLSKMLKSRVQLRITEFNRARRRVVGSIRSVTAELRRIKAEEIWNNIAVGKKYKGVVKSLTTYGVFVDIGGVDGMVHVSELSWERVRQPSDVVKVGDELEVFVHSFDPEKKKISLGHRKPEDNPWNKFAETYKIGDVVDATVVKLMPFGAFAKIIPGVDGLIHISQITDRRIGKPSDAVNEGDVLKVKIVDVDYDNKKISLSARALLEEVQTAQETGPDEVVATSEPGKTVIAGE